MTPADAQAAHDAATARDAWLMWSITATHVEYPSNYDARAHGRTTPAALSSRAHWSRTHGASCGSCCRLA